VQATPVPVSSLAYKNMLQHRKPIWLGNCLRTMEAQFA